jgi:hypothetical protein
MKYLCIGNPTSHTDDITTGLAKTNKSINRGLATKIDEDGFYHISLADITILEAETFIEQFDQLYFLQQPKESYDSEEVYNNTRILLLYVKNWQVKPFELINV